MPPQESVLKKRAEQEAMAASSKNAMDDEDLALSFFPSVHSAGSDLAPRLDL